MIHQIQWFILSMIQYSSYQSYPWLIHNPVIHKILDYPIFEPSGPWSIQDPRNTWLVRAVIPCSMILPIHDSVILQVHDPSDPWSFRCLILQILDPADPLSSWSSIIQILDPSDPWSFDPSNLWSFWSFLLHILDPSNPTDPWSCRSLILQIPDPADPWSCRSLILQIL